VRPAAFYINLLADEGPLLSEPYTRQPDRKLRELRLHLDRQAAQITVVEDVWVDSNHLTGSVEKVITGPLMITRTVCQRRCAATWIFVGRIDLACHQR
jgi:hypothetical protein